MLYNLPDNQNPYAFNVEHVAHNQLFPIMNNRIVVGNIFDETVSPSDFGQIKTFTYEQAFSDPKKFYDNSAIKIKTIKEFKLIQETFEKQMREPILLSTCGLYLYVVRNTRYYNLPDGTTQLLCKQCYKLEASKLKFKDSGVLTKDGKHVRMF